MIIWCMWYVGLHIAKKIIRYLKKSNLGCVVWEIAYTQLKKNSERSIVCQKKKNMEYIDQMLLQ